MRPETPDIQEFLLARGAGQLAHPGGTLYAHLNRVAALLAEWGADEDLQVAGLCHAFYGTDGFGQALLTVDERPVLRALAGARAESLVYLYGSCDRAAGYPLLAGSGPVQFRDRFTGGTHTPPAGYPCLHRADGRQRTRRDAAQRRPGRPVRRIAATACRRRSAVAHRRRPAGLEPATQPRSSRGPGRPAGRLGRGAHRLGERRGQRKLTAPRDPAERTPAARAAA